MREKRENIRIDDLTYQLLLALIQQQLDFNNNKVTKSEVYRRAVYRMAKEDLPEEDFKAIVTNMSDIERL